MDGTHVTQNKVKWRNFLKKVVNILGTSKARNVFGWLSDCQDVKVKADSHIACRAHAVPMPFPCHAVR